MSHHRTARVYFSDRLRETESGVLFSKTPSCDTGSAAPAPRPKQAAGGRGAPPTLLLQESTQRVTLLSALHKITLTHT